VKFVRIAVRSGWIFSLGPVAYYILNTYLEHIYRSIGYSNHIEYANNILKNPLKTQYLSIVAAHFTDTFVYEYQRRASDL